MSQIFVPFQERSIHLMNSNSNLEKVYQNLSDTELIKLAEQPEKLKAEAIPILQKELLKRNLREIAEQLSEIPNRSDIKSLSVEQLDQLIIERLETGEPIESIQLDLDDNGVVLTSHLKSDIETPSQKRPVIITIICIIGFIGALITIPMIFSDAAWRVGGWYPPFLAISMVIGVFCFIGFWEMRQWAAYLYTTFFVLSQFVLIMTGLWNPLSLILPVIIILIVFANIKSMD